MLEILTPAARRGGVRRSSTLARRLAAGIAIASLAIATPTALAGKSKPKPTPTPKPAAVDKKESCISSTPDPFKPISKAEVSATIECFENLVSSIQQVATNASAMTSTCPDSLPTAAGAGLTAVSASWLDTVSKTIKAKSNYYDAADTYYSHRKGKSKDKRASDVKEINGAIKKITHIGFDLTGGFTALGQFAAAVTANDCDSATQLAAQIQSAVKQVQNDQTSLAAAFVDLEKL